MARIQFGITGEYITDIVRTWFWEENKGLEKCLNFLKESLICEGTEIDKETFKRLCIEILEGKRKLIGVNNFELVEDGENIRLIEEYYKKLEYKFLKEKIKNHIHSNPLLYFDEYAMYLSKVFIENCYDLKDLQDKIEQYINNHSSTFRTFRTLDYGMYIIYNVDIWADKLARVLENVPCRKEDIEIALFKIYENEINILRSENISIEELNDYELDILKRNNRYMFDKEYSYLGNSIIDIDYFIPERWKKELKKEKELQKAKVNRSKSITDLLNEVKKEKGIPMITSTSNMLTRFTQDINKDFDTTPIKQSDIPEGWEGFVDKEGNFYKTKPIGARFYLGSINCHSDFIDQYIEENNIKIPKGMYPKDYIIKELGWCAYGHSLYLGVYVNTPKLFDDNKKITEKQKISLLTLFELNNDDMNYYKRSVEEKYLDI